jgi:hypothetical protein
MHMEAILPKSDTNIRLFLNLLMTAIDNITIVGIPILNN